MAGTVTEAYTTEHSVKTFSMTWVSSAGGAADLASSNRRLQGLIRKVKIIPDLGNQPTLNFNVRLNDADGDDVLANGGLTATNLTNTIITLDPPTAVDDNLTLAITAAGNAKGGIVRVYYTNDKFQS